MNKIKLVAIGIILASTALVWAGTRHETESIEFGGPVTHTNTLTVLDATNLTDAVNLRSLTNYVSTNTLFTTNTGLISFSAATTNNAAINMIGTEWNLTKPAFWSTNVPFSATANLSIFNSTNLFGCNELWRSSVAFASVYNTNAITLGTNILYVSDGTPFSALITPFQCIIVDATSNECVTVTNVTGGALYCRWPTRYSHAATNCVSHLVSLAVDGPINNIDGLSVLKIFIEFNTAQTVDIGYAIPYTKVK